MNDPKYDIYRSAPIIKAPKNIQFGGGNNRKSSPKTSNFSGSFFFQAFVLGFFLVMASASGKIFFKQMTNKMPNYPFFLSIFIVLMAIPFYYIIYLNLEVKQAWDVAIQKKGLDLTVNKEVDELYWESRKKRGFQFSKKKLFVMGILDSFAGLLMVFGGKGTSGTLQTLLFQAVIPLTMVLAIVFLKERYTIAQYLGSFGVVLGVFVSFIPSLMDNSNLIYVLVYLSAVIPTAVSSIYKEHTLKKMFVNMFYLQAWVSFFQFIASFIFLPINCIPVIGGIDFMDIPKNIYQGALCFIGIPSRDGDDCHWVYLPILGYTLANFLFNLLSLYILKNLSSAIVYIQNTVRLPLVAIAFHIPLIMGDDTIPWGKSDYYTFGGLAFIVAGLLLYMKDAVKKKSTSTLPLINEHSTLLPESIEKYYHSAPLPTLPNNSDVLGIDPENIRSVFMG